MRPDGGRGQEEGMLASFQGGSLNISSQGFLCSIDPQGQFRKTDFGSHSLTPGKVWILEFLLVSSFPLSCFSSLSSSPSSSLSSLLSPFLSPYPPSLFLPSSPLIPLCLSQPMGISSTQGRGPFSYVPTTCWPARISIREGLLSLSSWL